MSRFKLFHHKEIDPEKWDLCIINCGYELIYAMSWYLNEVSPGWKAFILEEKGAYKAVFPLTWKQKFGIKYLYKPFITQQLGLFTAELSYKEVYLAECLQLLTSTFRYIDYPLNEAVPLLDPGSSQPLFQVSHGVTYLLDLQPTYQEIQKGYHENLRRNIKKAKGSQAIVSSEPTAIRELIHMYRQHMGNKLDGVGDKQYQVLEQVYHQAQQKEAAMLLTARDQDGQLLAGAVYLKFGKRITYIFGGSSERGKQLRIMPLIMDECIKTMAQKAVFLDFEGSIIPSLARFYGSFGAQPVSFDLLKYNRLPYLLRLVKK